MPRHSARFGSTAIWPISSCCPRYSLRNPRGNHVGMAVRLSLGWQLDCHPGRFRQFQGVAVQLPPQHGGALIYEIASGYRVFRVTRLWRCRRRSIAHLAVADADTHLAGGALVGHGEGECSALARSQRIEVLGGRPTPAVFARGRRQFHHAVLRGRRLAADRDLDAVRGAIAQRRRPAPLRSPWRRRSLFQHVVRSRLAAQIHGAFGREPHVDRALAGNHGQGRAHQVERLYRSAATGSGEWPASSCSRRRTPARRLRRDGHRYSCPGCKVRSYLAPSRNEAQAFSAASRGRGNIVLVEDGPAVGRAGLGREPEVLADAQRAQRDQVPRVERGHVGLGERGGM